MKHASRFTLLLSLIMLISQPAWAARLMVHDAAESPEYKRKFGGMIGRGALNALTCFVDPVVNVVNETKAGPPLVGMLTGLGKGLGCGVLRLGSGAVDLITFWVPGFNGVPVASSYENCLADESGGMAAAPAIVPLQATPSVAAGWDVPTAEPGAAQAPATISEPTKRKWVK